MQTAMKTFGSSVLLSILLILPFMAMEVINRRSYHEDFPAFLFFAMWLNLFAFILILLPVVQARWESKHATEKPDPARRNTLLANPNSAALVSLALFLVPGSLFLLDTLGWVSTDRLFNGPDPEQAYLPGTVLSLVLFLFPIAAGVITRLPVVRTLRAGGGLFAHPVNLLIAVLLAAVFAIGLGSFIVDQWPCFMGVPMCD